MRLQQGSPGADVEQRAVTRENNPNYPMPNPFYFEGKINYE